MWHEYRRPYAQCPFRERDRLRVVARGVGQDPPGALLRDELRDRVHRPAELEGPRALEVLALQEEPPREPLVEGARGRDRGAVRDAAEPRGRGEDVVVGDHGPTLPEARRRFQGRGESCV